MIRKFLSVEYEKKKSIWSAIYQHSGIYFCLGSAKALLPLNHRNASGSYFIYLHFTSKDVIKSFISFLFLNFFLQFAVATLFAHI